ncbi:Adenylate kinase [Polynucleobacter meluiroseus]|uniref:Adenylate kinase n=2 Tax=Polynucleobacter meluiroseus TaxID=1938814 RepID=A0A240E1K5_9BURK|nr:AAA family ATPase [Polynucleobacter meluiroseus]SNX29319.1 Adenylate kinase [Polynucleobacter meluiroseus]
MHSTLNSSAPRLILFAGHAGTGKSTLAKKALPLLVKTTGANFALLDKDTAYGDFSAHVMDLNTGNPNDRDSPYYLQNLRDWEYSGLLAIAKENLELGVNVILVGPFSREIQSGRMFAAESLGLPLATPIRIAWIDLSIEEAKLRMQKRANPRDTWKLDHWESYVERRVNPPEHPTLQRFDNGEFDAANFEKLVAHLAD